MIPANVLYAAIRAKKVTIKKTAKSKPCNTTLKKLRARKKYIVKIRPYIIAKEPIGGTKVKVYGKWSAVKGFKTK